MSNLNDLIEELIGNMELEEQKKCIDILNQLSECEGFDVNSPINFDDYNGETLLMRAIDYGCLDVVKYLIEVLDADPNIQNYYGFTALHEASYWDRYEIIDYLISVTGIDVNKKNYGGHTALHLAAYCENKLSVKVLLKSNELGTSLRDQAGETAEQVARHEGHHEIADMIAAYEPSISAFDNK